jgi:hypothetical protein
MTATQAARRELGVLSGALFVVLWLVGMFYASAQGVAYPRPTDDMAKVGADLKPSASILATQGGIQLLSGVALLFFAAAMAGYLRRRGSGGELVLAGGAASAVLLMISAATGPIMGTDLAGDNASMQLLYQLQFWTGGPLHVAAFGLLVIGIAQAAGLPKWLTVSGYVIGGLGLLSSLMGVLSFTVMFTPIGRFLGFIWLLIATIMIAVGRKSTVEADKVTA